MVIEKMVEHRVDNLSKRYNIKNLSRDQGWPKAMSTGWTVISRKKKVSA